MTANLVRVVFEHRNGREWELRTSDLSGFARQLGEDVLIAFAACYIHADRLTSLVTMLYFSLEKYGNESALARRNFATFYAFVVGTLKELSLWLAKLRSALVGRGIWDQTDWEQGLKKWEEWGGRHETSEIRNRLAFHVDPEWVRTGISGEGAAALIMEGDSPKERDGWFRLGHAALLEGAHLELGGLERILGEPREFLQVRERLDPLFLQSLERADLKPLMVIVKGGQSSVA